MTLGFSPGVWKLGHLLCKYQIIAKQWPVTNRSSPMNMLVRRCFRAFWDCLAMSGVLAGRAGELKRSAVMREVGERIDYRHNTDSSTSCRNDREIDLFAASEAVPLQSHAPAGVDRFCADRVLTNLILISLQPSGCGCYY